MKTKSYTTTINRQIGISAGLFRTDTPINWWMEKHSPVCSRNIFGAHDYHLDSETFFHRIQNMVDQWKSKKVHFPNISSVARPIRGRWKSNRLALLALLLFLFGRKHGKNVLAKMQTLLSVELHHKYSWAINIITSAALWWPAMPVPNQEKLGAAATKPAAAASSYDIH